MISPVSQSGARTYNVNCYVVDTEAEVGSLPINCAMGSTAVVIENGAKYILNSKRQWIKQPAETAGGGIGGNGGTSGDDIIILGDKTSSSGDILIL